MGGAQGFQLRELDSHFFHGSGAALAGVPRTAHFCSARLVATVVAAELEEPSAWLWPAALRARPMAQQCSSSSSSHAVHRSHCRGHLLTLTQDLTWEGGEQLAQRGVHACVNSWPKEVFTQCSHSGDVVFT